jgi:deazaflavin-dependent oxidoreductase (nitroreductase family)
MIDLDQLATEDFCYLITTGRISGRLHTIEIWFALNESTLYMLSDGGLEKADWVKNINRQPDVKVKIKDHQFDGKGRLTFEPEEDTLLRRLIGEKYRKKDDDLESWLQTAFPVAVDLIMLD